MVGQHLCVVRLSKDFAVLWRRAAQGSRDTDDEMPPSHISQKAFFLPHFQPLMSLSSVCL